MALYSAGLWVGSIVPIALVLAGCMSSPSPITGLVEDQLARYPEMQVQDWYKLLHQAAMGNRHLGVEDDVIYNYLLDELDRIEAAQEEPLVEYISPDSSIIRLNLRPFKARGGNPDSLFAAMKVTWDTVVPSTELLTKYWTELKAVRPLPYSETELDAYFEQRRAEGFPAVHHSDAYESTYRPAYRVVLR